MDWDGFVSFYSLYSRLRETGEGFSSYITVIRGSGGCGSRGGR